MKGSGKTYALGRVFESLLDEGVQVVALDSVGKMYGIRLEADGKTPSKYQVVIMGGHRGQFPLTPESGALIADAVVDTGRSMILDISLFSREGRRKFCTAFAERLWARKKEDADPAPMHILIEECHLVIPQKPQKGEERMLGIFEEIGRLGRNFGIGVSLATQRPQSVNKEVLSQVEVLFAFQMNHNLERKAVKDWIVDKGLDVNLVDELPSLEQGQAWLWSPALLGVLEKVRIAKKTTFDASATPKVGAKRVERKLHPLDFEDLAEKMNALVEEQKANDPAALRREIVQLRHQLSAKAPAAPPEIKTVTVNVVDPKHVDRLNRITEDLLAQVAKLREDVAKAATKAETSHVLGKVDGRNKSFTLVGVPSPAVVRTSEGLEVHGRTVTVVDRSRRVYPGTGAAFATKEVEVTKTRVGDVQIKDGARRILRALAQFPGPQPRKKVALMAKLKVGTGTYRDYVAALRKAELIVDHPNGDMEINAAGRAFIGPVEKPKTSNELIQLWAPRLKAGARRMLDVLVQAYPKWVDRDSLGAAVNITNGTGTYRDYLAALRKAQLVEDGQGDLIRANPDLFLGDAA